MTIEVYDSQDTIADRCSAMDAVLEVLRARIDDYAGLRNVRIERVGDRITVELFGSHDAALVKSILQQRGFFETRLLTDGEDFTDALPALDSLVLAASPNLDETSPLSALLR